MQVTSAEFNVFDERLLFVVSLSSLSLSLVPFFSLSSTQVGLLLESGQTRVAVVVAVFC